MSSFKQKLKSLLKDSKSFQIPKNNEQKFGQIMRKTYRKIKIENSRQSILLANKTFSSKTINSLTSIYLPEKLGYDKNSQKGISPKTASNMLQALSLLKYKNSIKLNKAPTLEKITKYINDNLKIKSTVRRNIFYLRNGNSISNYSIYNRPRTSFNSRNNSSKKKPVYKLKKTYTRNINTLIKKTEDNFFSNNNVQYLKNVNSNIFKYQSFI